MSPGNYDPQDLGSFQDFLNDAAERIAASLPHLRKQMGERVLEQTVACNIINAVHAFAEAIPEMTIVSDEYADYLETQDDTSGPSTETGEQLPATDVLHDPYTTEMLNEFFTTRSPFTAAELRRYLELSEDFTDDEIKKIVRNISTCLAMSKESMAQAGVRTYVLTDRDLQELSAIDGAQTKTPKRYALAILEEAPVQPITPRQEQQKVDGQRVAPSIISLIEMTKESFAVESMNDEQCQAVREFILSLFDNPQERIVSSSMKMRVIEALNNRLIKPNEANNLLNKAYQARLVGKQDQDDKVYYVTNPEQRRDPKERASNRSEQKAKKETVIDYVGMGVGDIFTVLVEDLTHAQQKLTPDKISRMILGRTGRTMSTDMIKAMTRSLDMYFIAAEGTLAGNKSPHAQSRAQKVFTIRLKDQFVKKAWKDNPKKVLNDINATYIASQKTQEPGTN